MPLQSDLGQQSADTLEMNSGKLRSTRSRIRFRPVWEAQNSSSRLESAMPAFSGERCHISSFAFLMRCHRGTTGMFSRSTCAGTRGVQRGCAGNQSSTLRASFSWLAVSSM